MCGIVAAIAERPVQAILLEGLKRLNTGRRFAESNLVNGQIERTRAQGKVAELGALLSDSRASQGIAHTGWLLMVSRACNAHPHQSGRFAVVHNGIIENYELLKSELSGSGIYLNQTLIRKPLHLLHYLSQPTRASTCRGGDYSAPRGCLCASDSDAKPPEFYGSLVGQPLVLVLVMVSISPDQTSWRFFTTDRFIFLDEGDSAKLTSTHSKFLTIRPSREVGRLRRRPPRGTVRQGRYRHFMLQKFMSATRSLDNSTGLYD